MALRAFQNNPSIGGFGNESGLIIGRQEDERQRQQHRNNEGVKSNPRSADGDDVKVVGRRVFTKNESLHRPQSGCDAFAQILKELVDNAVDACSSGVDSNCGEGAFGNKRGQKGQKERKKAKDKCRLKRVRVSIEKVCSSSSSILSQPNKGCNVSEGGTPAHESNAFKNDQNKRQEVADGENDILRVTVSDNGCGMDDIEKCVSVFSTSKVGAVTNPMKDDSNDKESRSGSECKKNHNPVTTSGSLQSQTAGRYGIGLTLCLLHAQRLVPNSCAKIISSTSSKRCWTVAKFVVDTDRDTVICVEKKNFEKKGGSNESGTAVSLLVPGGVNAQRAWPRLAEYFARFQLSLELRCSLQVMAPSLSPRPLFIRPVCEKKEMQRRKIQQQHTEEIEKVFETNTEGSSRVENDDDKNDNNNENEGLHYSNPKNGDGSIEWIDSIYKHGVDIISSLSDSQNSEESNKVDCSVEKEDEEDEAWIDSFDNDLKSLGMGVKELPGIQPDDALTSKTIIKNSNDCCQKKLIQAAVSSYLQKSVPVENIAHSNQRIRIEGGKLESDTRKSNGPSLEVCMIVCEREEEESNDEQEFSDEDTINSNADIDPKTAKIFLIRMVNEIPLLDGAEASACGIVQGIARKRSMWNSFGLDVAPLSQSALPTNICNKTSQHNHRESSSFLQIPTFCLRDSLSVAPYFSSQNRAHSLFNDDIEEDESTCSSIDNISIDDGRKRKKKPKVLLLPAGLRLGKILIIVQLRANPMDLPLPTLSKGRLPMNDKGIDDALELGISSCLHSLQNSKPSLLLNASQLKKTERDVKFIPSIASALSSIVLNCHDSEQQRNMMDIINSWTVSSLDGYEKLSIVTPGGNKDSSTPLEFDSEANDSISEEDEINRSTQETGFRDEPNMNADRYISLETQNSIALKFREVMSLIGERKAEQIKKSRAQYFHKKKRRTRLSNSQDDDEQSNVSSVSGTDLDDFLTKEYTHSESELDSSPKNVDPNKIERNSNGVEGRTSDENDFDDDEWW